MATRPRSDARRTLGALVAAAGRGKPDLAWLEKAIRKAGYVPAAEVVTKADLKAAVAWIVAALAEAEAPNPCCRKAIESVQAKIKKAGGGQ